MNAGNKVNYMLRRLNSTLRKNGPDILTKFCIGGIVVTVGLAIQATTEAVKRVESRKEADGVETLTPMETIKVAAPCYLPTAASCALTIACAASANSAHSRRNAALATAYSISETALRDYQKKVADTVGTEKAEEIQQAVDQDVMDAHPCPKEMEQGIVDGNGRHLCYESKSGRYFYSDKNTIREAAEELNHKMNTMPESYVSLNELYMELDLPCTEIGDEIGWNVNRGLIKPKFSAVLTRGGVPCILVSYDYPPEYNYDRV